MLSINQKLNLVFPVDTSEGTIWVHSTPIPYDVFKKYYHVIAGTFANLVKEGLHVVAGPRVALIALEEVATARGEWDTPDGIKNGLLAEIRRLTNVVLPSPEGWKTLPYHVALKDHILTDDDILEVEGVLCFFTCASAMHLRNQLLGILTGMSLYWGGQITSLNSMEYAASLPTSIETETSNQMAATSSVPS